MTHANESSTRPLSGSTIVVTREASRADELVAPLEALGAHVITYSATRTLMRDTDRLRSAACALARYDWVIFTSGTAVSLMFDATEACGIVASNWAQTRVAAVGTATAAAIRARGVQPTMVPDRFVAEGLLAAFASGHEVQGTTMLYPAAFGARRDLEDGLRAMGANVDRIDAYESVVTEQDAAEIRTALQAGRVDIVTLTARSAVEAWVAAMHPVYAAADVVSIGPVTTQAARGAGLRVAAEAMPSTIEGLVYAVVRAVRARRDRQPSQSLAE